MRDYDPDDMRPDRRKQRADSLLHLVLDAIRPHIVPIGARGERMLASALYTAFYEAGADAVTDADRANAGLPPRDAKGWTAQELAALELFRLQVMCKPRVVTVPQAHMAKNPAKQDDDRPRDYKGRLLRRKPALPA